MKKAHADNVLTVNKFSLTHQLISVMGILAVDKNFFLHIDKLILIDSPMIELWKFFVRLLLLLTVCWCVDGLFFILRNVLLFVCVRVVVFPEDKWQAKNLVISIQRASKTSIDLLTILH